MRDAVVIGAGGGGAVMAKELAARGLDVLVLEAGPAGDHPERRFSHLENDAVNPVTGYMRWGPGDRTRAPWNRDLPQNSVLFQVAGAGGTTLHYWGNSPRAHPGVFLGYAGADATAFDRAHAFPLTYSELVPYYEWVEATLPVHTAPYGRKEEIFFGACEAVGLPLQRGKDITGAGYRPQENAILPPGGTAGRTADAAQLRYPQATGCTFCGNCYLGCLEPRGAPRNLSAKRSTDTSYLPMALTADLWTSGGRAVTLVADAFVTAIGVETPRPGGRPAARTVSWRSVADDSTHTESAQVVVLCAGPIETPRLWLNAGLPNPNGWVGQGMTTHDFDFVVGRLPFASGFAEGPQSQARADLPGLGALEHLGFPPALTGSALALSDSGMAGLYTNGGPVGPAGADSVGRLIGNHLRRFLGDHDRLMAIQTYTDDDVEAANAVSLSTALPPDEHGRVPKVTVGRRRRSARTKANREAVVALAVQVLRAAGAVEIARIDWPPLLIHMQSTMRMGISAADSVLDAHGAARAVGNLYVADNSALANALGSVNPTLTTQALATRTAERIVTSIFGGDPWVGREAPVCSAGPEVTAAVLARPRP